MSISEEIDHVQTSYESIPKQLEELLHRLRCLRRTGRAGKENLRRIGSLELDILELQDIFRHQGYVVQ